ncbi:excinuclease ABC subunit UvrC [bacterium]|nr:excinuclease ABC subunit UvrC [candidate division CSSED10-310 bacterium]
MAVFPGNFSIVAVEVTVGAGERRQQVAMTDDGQRRAVVSKLPRLPGVYIYRDAAGRVIYVGKSHDLKARVGSYFQKAEHAAKTVQLVTEIRSLEWVVTDNEAEALLLESNLIKLHRPRYNIRLKDDKQYPYLRLGGGSFPQLEVVRKVTKDGAQYFGPYHSPRAMRATLRLVYRYFYLRRCKGEITGRETRHCLMGDMRWCSSPCTGAIDEKGYGALVRDVRMLLEGRSDQLVNLLSERMAAAAASLEFEKAAVLRDQIKAVRKVTQAQKVVMPDLRDRDVFAVACKGEQAVLSIFIVRSGRLVARDQRFVEIGTGMDMGSVMNEVIRRYYEVQPLIPGEILLAAPPSPGEDLAGWLSERRGARVRVLMPQRGVKHRFMRMVERDAAVRLRFDEQRGERFHAKALAAIREGLQLKRLPKRIEAYDISNMQGVMAVGSMVTFKDGEPERKRYRRFKIRMPAMVDDYAMMQEMLSRRLKRRDQEGWELPDMMLIDGGKGHLHAVLRVMGQEDVGDLDLVSLAKVRARRAEEGFFRPGRDEAMVLPPDSPELNLLRHIRDEAHRFAIEYHRKLMRKRTIASLLDEVPGIGAKRKRALVKRFGSVKRLYDAALEDMVATPGMSRSAATALRSFLDALRDVEDGSPALPDIDA